MTDVRSSRPAVVDFHFDIMCPYAYQTSLWIRNVREETGLEIASADLLVLVYERILYLQRAHVVLRQLARVQPDPHRIAPLPEDLDVADAGNALQGIDHLKIRVVAKRHGVSEPSIYSWRKKFGDLGTDDVKRLCFLTNPVHHSNCSANSCHGGIYE